MNTPSTKSLSTQNAGRKPDLVCIGAQKAGTSWLYEVLSERPDIWAPFKELHFFDHKFIDECSEWAEWHVRKEVKAAKKRCLANNPNPDGGYLEYLDSILEPPMFNGNWYKGVFSRAPLNSLCLDVSPEYSCIPEEGVKFVAKFLKKTQFIYIIRKPLDRALSQLQMNIFRKGTPSTKEEWMNYAMQPVIHSRGDYQAYIPRWEKYFAPNRLLFLPFSQIHNDSTGLLKQIESFAQLKPFEQYKKADRIIHPTKPIHIPEWVRELLAEKMQHQDEFLQTHFGYEFYSQI